MPKGGKRPGAGRPKGSKDKTPFDIREAALKKAAKAFDIIETIASGGKILPSTRLLAANAILDRAYGKPLQSTQMLDDAGKAIAPVFVQIVAATDDDVQRAIEAGNAPVGEETEDET